MEQLIATIEKGQPFFNAIARNKYLKAIRDGFISVIPIIIFSSIFCLVASVPNIWGFYWPDDINNALWKCYNYSMGILAIACAATTAKHFADAQNRDLPKNNQINFISCMCAAIIGFLLLSSDTIATDAASGFNTTYLGSKGLLTAFIAAFVTGIIYKFFIKRNITVKMPEQVPPNISQTFKDIIPFSVCITVFWVFDIVFRAAFGFCFAQGVIQVFQPLFTAADGYIGLAVIYGAMSLFWFVGVHGPSIVEPAPAVEAPVVETASATEASAAPSALKGKDLRVLVLCAGAGTSALLANALKEGADELGIDITANAGAYGSHYAIMDQYNVIVLAPQVRTYYNEMKADTDRLGITLLSPKGKQYIDLTKDPKGAVAWIEENLEA